MQNTGCVKEQQVLPDRLVPRLIILFIPYRIICIDEELIKKRCARKCFNPDPKTYNEKLNQADNKIAEFLEDYHNRLAEYFNDPTNYVD